MATYSQLFFGVFEPSDGRDPAFFPCEATVYTCLCDNTRNTSGDVKTGHRQSGKSERTYTCRKNSVQSVKDETQNMHKHTDTNTHIVCE